jgi:Glycosyl hydrolases family 16
LLPTGTFDGGEVRRRRASGWGRHRTHLRAAAAPGALTAFFLYLHDFRSDSSDELDVELPAGEPYRALLTVWRRGCHEPTDQRVVELPFDPATAVHSYEIVREPEGRVTFTIDDVITFASPSGPTGDLYPMFNAWYPDWLPCSGPSPGGFARVSGYAFHSF